MHFDAWCTIKPRLEFAGEQIPTLYEALDLCEELDILLLLDIKGSWKKVSRPYYAIKHLLTSCSVKPTVAAS